MSRKPLVVFGLTGFAEMVAHYFDHYSNYEVVAFTAHGRFCKAPEFAGRPVVPLEKLAVKFPVNEAEVFAAVEYKWLNGARAGVLKELQALGYPLASFIHPQAHVDPTAQLGRHQFIMEGVTISYKATLGEDNILFPQCLIGHQAQVGNHNFLQPGLLLNRLAVIGNHCVCSPGVTVADGVKVGDWTYLKTGQVVEADVAVGTTHHPLLRSPGYVVDRRAPAAVS